MNAVEETEIALKNKSEKMTVMMMMMMMITNGYETT
jgi:hypothetical protein